MESTRNRWIQGRKTVRIQYRDFEINLVRYLALTDSRGTCYEDDTIATGYASFLARPLMRAAKPSSEMTEAEAKELIETCLKVLFYRDARALDRVQIATVSARGVEISAPYDLKTDWDCGHILYSGFNIKNTNYLGNVNQ